MVGKDDTEFLSVVANVRLQLACIESLMQDNTHARALTTGQLDHVVSGV